MTQHDGSTEMDQFMSQLEDIGVAPLWMSLGDLVPEHPKPQDVPFRWRYRDVRTALLRAGELVSAEEAERRVLMLLNPTPEIAARGGTTSTLYAGIQLVLPEEVARAHHHVAGAFRFIIEAGEGAYTAVDGEKAMMRPGDLVLTTNWRFHDHHNETPDPVIWLDGLDIPVVNFFNANFYELHPDEAQKITEADDGSMKRYLHGRLTPAWEDEPPSPHSPLLRYPWAETERALRSALESGADSETDGVIFEYTHPRTGGPVMPTLACFIQALRPGQHTQARRRTPSAVYHVVRGGGSIVIDGELVEIEEGDTIAVPSWAATEFDNASTADELILFSFTNHHIYRMLDLYREELVPSQLP